MTGETYRLPGDLLFELGYLPFVPANNKPHYLYGPYESSRCEHHVEVPIREQYLWCPVCKVEGDEPSMLKRKFVAPAMQQVWHEHYNFSTGRVESDRKRMEQHLRAKSDAVSESLGIKHNFIRADYGELKRHAENHGMDLQTSLEATHDRAVTEGRRESRGKYVWQVDSKSA